MNNHFYYLGPAKSYEEALQRLNSHRGTVAIDTETIGLKGDKSTMLPDWDEDGNMISVAAKINARTMIGFGIAISPTEGFYFPYGKPTWKNVIMVDPYPGIRILENPDIHKVFFNSGFDTEIIGDNLNIEVENFDDVAIASQVQGLWNSLEANSGHLLGKGHTVIDDVLPKGKTMLDVPGPTTARKCIEDCFTTLELYYLYKMPEWKNNRGLVWQDHVSRKFDVTANIIDCYNVDLRCIPLLRKMSKRGIRLRPEVVKKWYYKLTREIQYYDNYFRPLGINPASNDQVGWHLTTRGHWLPFTESKKHYKVDEEILNSLVDPVAQMILARRRRQKLKSTYILPMMELDGLKVIDYKERAYTHYRLDLATGRLGSFDFNAQNQPAPMREIFGPDDYSDEWTWMDLHQAEMRVWAHQAQDDVMLKAFAENSSPHVATLNYLFPGIKKANLDGSPTREYVDSKSFNFALLADANDEILARTTRRPIELVHKFKQELYELYWKSREHQNNKRERKIDWFYPDYVESDFGRRCHIPDGLQVTYNHQEKCRLNYPFQATVADVIKRIMIGLDMSGIDFPFQVHDEIVADGVVTFPQWINQIHPVIQIPFEETRSKVWV